MAAPRAAAGPASRLRVAASLQGSEWKVTRVGGSAPAKELKLTLGFPDGSEFSGFDGCNHFGGSYRAGGKRLELRRNGRTLVVLKRR